MAPEQACAQLPLGDKQVAGVGTGILYGEESDSQGSIPDVGYGLYLGRQMPPL